MLSIVAPCKIDLGFMADELNKLATLEAKVNLLVLLEDLWIVRIGMLKRLVNVPL